MDTPYTAGPDLDYLHIDVEPAGPRHLRLVVNGELDRDTATALSSAFTEVLPARPEVVEFDLTRLTFVDAAGVRLLLRCQAAVREAGARAVLLHPTEQVRQVLRVLGISDGPHIAH